ncbi:hypothetical protein [Natrinema gelatinilyticum]|nr:hypothetical protein [Natrinema gelatinilyticum]
MNTLNDVVLATETQFPMSVVGWGVLVLGLLVTIAWMLYLYR